MRIINPIELGVRAKIYKKKLKFLARARAPKRKQKTGRKNIILKSTQNHFEMPRKNSAATAHHRIHQKKF